MKKIIFFILSILIIIPALLPIFESGFFVVHDNTQVERVFQMTKALSDGNFPVRWVEDLGYGYGYPIFNFYAPFPYYLAGFTNLAISNSLLATKIMFVIGIALSFYTMYLLASKITNKYGGVAAGVVYLYFPYHALNIYVRGAVGEFFAYAFMPLVFLGIYKIYENLSNKKNFKKVLLNSFLYSIPLTLVAISHNLSAYMMGILLVPYVTFFLVKTRMRKEFAVSIVVLFATAFLLSSFYVLPAVFESKFTNVESQIGGGANYENNFVCPEQLWHSDWGFGGSIPGCIDGMSFALGKFNILLVFISLLFFLNSLLKKKKSTAVIFWVLLSVSLLMTLPISKIFWDGVPYMEYLQYPWRFLNFAGLFLSISTAFLVFSIKDKKAVLLILLLIIFGQLYFNAKLFKPNAFTGYDNNYYEDLDHIKWDTSRISDEYLPSGFQKPNSRESLPKDLLNQNSESIGVIEERTGYFNFTREGKAEVVTVNRAYFPGWKVYSNGFEVEIAEANKGMEIFLPEGKSNVTGEIKSTPIQVLSNVLSLIGLVIVIVVIIVKRKRLYE